MILSNVSIQCVLDEGYLVIEPQPGPRQPSADGPECPYQTSAVDLRLGEEVTWLKEGLPLNIDLRGGGFSKLFVGENAERRMLKDDDPYVLQPNHFVLAKTNERIQLPIREDGPWLAARVEGRSSYARCGLLVHFTAPTIHAGFVGTITLEMMNFGRYPISLYPRMPICQLIIEKVDSRPFRNDNQFQGQTGPAGH
jgi:dCTP deaminase